MANQVSFVCAATDTIDLQDHQAPWTQIHPKNHAVEPTIDDPRNHIAPHQAETLREVALESAEENLRSPRLGGAQGQASANQQSESTNINGYAQNGVHSDPAMDAYRQHEQETLAAHDAGGSSSDEEPLDGDDAELDDDLMDKISSSPSIEDGACYPRLEATPDPVAWPRRGSSLPYSSSSSSSPTGRPAAQLYPSRCATASPPRRHVGLVSASRSIHTPPQYRQLLPRPLLLLGEYSGKDVQQKRPREPLRAGFPLFPNASARIRCSNGGEASIERRSWDFGTSDLQGSVTD